MLHSHLTTLNAVSLILQVFQEQDVDAQQLLAGSGIGLADLEHPDARITTQQELQVCANALARREDIGLELGRRMHVSCYGMLGYALLSSATLGDALRLALTFPALLGTVFQLRLVDDGQRVWLSASDHYDAPGLAAFNADSGRPAWGRDMSSYAGVAVNARAVVVTDAEGNVWAFDRQGGANLWKQDGLLHRWLGPPAIVGNHVVVGDLEGYVHWLALDTGAFAARERLSKKPIESAPVVAGDVVYVEDVEGRIGAWRSP